MSPFDAAITGASTNAPMTDPKKAEAQNEELDLEQLEDAAGGVIHPSYLTDPTKIVDPIWQDKHSQSSAKIVDPTKPERSRRADTNNLWSDNPPKPSHQ